MAHQLENVIMNATPENRPEKGHSQLATQKVTTSDIIGQTRAKPTPSGKSKPVIPRKWAKYYRNLLHLRETLAGQRSSHALEARETRVNFSLHAADAGTDSFDRDFCLSLLTTDQQALDEVEAALNRIKDGTYGVCELTGKPIPRPRLEVLPWTRFSASAAKQLEQEHALAHTRLGSRGTVQDTEPLKKEIDEE